MKEKAQEIESLRPSIYDHFSRENPPIDNQLNSLNQGNLSGNRDMGEPSSKTGKNPRKYTIF